MTLWREIAKLQFPILEKAMGDVREGSCAKVTLTYLVLKEPRSPAVQSARVLHSTEQNSAELGGRAEITHGPRFSIAGH